VRTPGSNRGVYAVDQRTAWKIRDEHVEEIIDTTGEGDASAGAIVARWPPAPT